MHPSIPLMPEMNNKSQQSSRGDVIEVNSTGDSSAREVQDFKFFQF
jgi:hypothetical protein